MFVCRSTQQHLTDEEPDSPVHKDMRCKFDESIEHHLGPAALPQDFPAEDLTPDPTYYDDTNAMDPEYGDAEVQTELTANMIAESLYSQCDPDGNQCVLLEEIVNHQCLPTAIKLSDQKIVCADAKTYLKCSTVG